MKSITSTCATNRFVGILGLVFALTGPQTCLADAFDVGDIHSWQFNSPNSTQEVAKNAAKQLLPALVLHDNAFAQRLGFNAAAEVSPNLTTGTAYAVFTVSLQRLLDYDSKSQSALWLLLGDSNFIRNSSPIPAKFLFPILGLGGAVKTSVSVHMPPTAFAWEVFRIGSPQLIKALTNNGSATNYFVISVPALNRYYLGKIEGSLFKIKTIFPDPLGINEGQEKIADQVFPLLQVEALHISKSAPR